MNRPRQDSLLNTSQPELQHSITGRSLPWWLGGCLALLVIAGLTLLPMASMLVRAGSIEWAGVLSDTYTQRIVRFSLYQATLSTLLSLAIALPVALAMAHSADFRGRSFIVTLFSLSLVIPTIVAIYGIVAVYGRTGWLSSLLGTVGVDPLSFYGLSGILIAHVFFNMPLATRVLLIALESIPDTNWRLARQLGMQPLAIWRFIEWPSVRKQLPGLALLIFTLCFTSFAIVMTLGGGPAATTIEVAIYQALRFDFDLSMAVALACIQLSICLLLTLLSTLFRAESDVGFQGFGKLLQLDSTDAGNVRLHLVLWRNPWQQAGNAIVITVASVFVLAPLCALLLAGFNTRTLAIITDSTTLVAMANTGVAALSSALIAVALRWVCWSVPGTFAYACSLNVPEYGCSWQAT